MIIFVGDKPSPRMHVDALPFEGAKCEPRLKAWIKLLRGGRKTLVINRVDRLLSYYVHAWYWRPMQYKFVALGNAASKALGEVPHFKLPHPSGLNRQLNDKAFVADKLAECKTWLNS